MPGAVPEHLADFGKRPGLPQFHNHRKPLEHRFVVKAMTAFRPVGFLDQSHCCVVMNRLAGKRRAADDVADAVQLGRYLKPDFLVVLCSSHTSLKIKAKPTTVRPADLPGPTRGVGGASFAAPDRQLPRKPQVPLGKAVRDVVGYPAAINFYVLQNVKCLLASVKHFFPAFGAFGPTQGLWPGSLLRWFREPNARLQRLQVCRGGLYRGIKAYLPVLAAGWPYRR